MEEETLSVIDTSRNTKISACKTCHKQRSDNTSILLKKVFVLVYNSTNVITRLLFQCIKQVREKKNSMEN